MTQRAPQLRQRPERWETLVINRGETWKQGNTTREIVAIRHTIRDRTSMERYSFADGFAWIEYIETGPTGDRRLRHCDSSSWLTYAKSAQRKEVEHG